jgi:uncharacterized protein YodC (DUF2158 family)
MKQEVDTNMADEIILGDMVELKSGGPLMTVENIGKYGMGSTKDQAKCVWFENKKRMEALFELHTLKKSSKAIS